MIQVEKVDDKNKFYYAIVSASNKTCLAMSRDYCSAASRNRGMKRFKDSANEGCKE